MPCGRERAHSSASASELGAAIDRLTARGVKVSPGATLRDVGDKLGVYPREVRRLLEKGDYESESLGATGGLGAVRRKAQVNSGSVG